MLKYFKYNHFSGLSASTLCLLGTQSCKDVLNDINSSYIISTLENLDIEIDILNRVLSNLQTSQKWSEIYDTLEPRYHLGVEGSKRKDVLKLYKNIYGAFKAKELGNTEVYNQYPEDIRNNVEIPEIQETLRTLVDDIEELSEVSEIQYTVQGGLVTLSPIALALLKGIYINRNTLTNLKSLVSDSINSKAKILSRDEIFGTPIYNLKRIGNNLSNINTVVNLPFKKKLDSIPVNEIKSILDDYKSNCESLLQLFSEEDLEDNREGIDLRKALRDSKKDIYIQSLVVEAIKEYFMLNGMADVMEQNVEAFNFIVEKLANVNNFIKIIQHDAQYLEDVVSLSFKLLKVDAIFYADMVGLNEGGSVDISDSDKYRRIQQSLLSAFGELADIGVGGLTFYAFDHFLQTLRSVDLSASQDKFHLDSKSYQGLIDNTQIMLKCIDSYEYFM